MLTSSPTSLWKRPTSQSENVKRYENRFVWRELFCHESTSCGSSGRSATWNMLVHWSSRFVCSTTWLSRRKHNLLPQAFDIKPTFCSVCLSFWSNFGFISGRTYSVLRWVRHNSKIGSRNDFLNTKCHFAWELTKAYDFWSPYGLL